MKKILAKIFEKKKMTRLMSKDWLLKFISLVLAVILWYFVGGEDRIDKNVMVPIEIINLPRDLVISNQFKKEIEVTVSGPRSLILEMANRAVTRQVDLSTATPGTMVIENDNNHIPVLRGITVQRVQPSSIILSLDKLIQKQFPVEIKTTGRVAHGYQIKKLKSEPEVITIAGPYTTLSQVDHFYTKAINLDGVKQSMQLQIPLELEAAIVELIGETSVTADLTIGLETVAVTFDNLRVSGVVNGQNREVQPDQVKVVANIPRLFLEKKNDLKNILSAVAVSKEGSSDLKVKIIPRADLEIPLEIVSITPDTVLAVGEEKSAVLKEENLVNLPDAPQATSPREKPGESTDLNRQAPLKILKNNKAKVKLLGQ